ncbi:MAG: hypothetical protein ACJ75J_16355 [Cytophagaceae bacterium]|jgi:hypothetical protein
MKVFFSFLIILSGSINVFAQFEIDRNDQYLLSQKNSAQGKNDSISSLISLHGGYFLNSNSINNNFVRFFRSNFITDENKTENEKRLKSVNRLGFEMNAGLTWMKKGKQITYVVGLNERRLASAKFSKDFFELVFRGNSDYVGKNAQLSPLNITYFNYESLYLGVQKDLKEKKLMLGGGISLIRAGTFAQAKIKTGTMYTDTAYTYLDFNMDYQLSYPDNAGSLFGSTNGMGLAGSFYLSWLKEKGQLNFEIRDLGFISYRNMNVYSGNSTYRYNGYNVNNVLQFNDSIFSNIKADTIAQGMGLHKEKKNFGYVIPATFHVNYVYNYSDRLTLVGGIKQMINVAYIPRLYLKSVYYVKKDLAIIPMIAYGGFGRGDFELGVSKSFKDKLMVSVNLFYLEYFILPKKSSGNGFNFSLTKLF